MTLSLNCDNRYIDGATAANFLQDLQASFLAPVPWSLAPAPAAPDPAPRV